MVENKVARFFYWHGAVKLSTNFVYDVVSVWFSGSCWPCVHIEHYQPCQSHVTMLVHEPYILMIVSRIDLAKITLRNVVTQTDLYADVISAKGQSGRMQEIILPEWISLICVIASHYQRRWYRLMGKILEFIIGAVSSSSPADERLLSKLMASPRHTRLTIPVSDVGESVNVKVGLILMKIIQMVRMNQNAPILKHFCIHRKRDWINI